MTSGEAQRSLPRGLVGVALPVAALALVVFFVLVLFPYDRFRDVVIARLVEATGASVSMDALGGGLSIGGPSLKATNLLFRWPDRRELLLARARVRPAWSLSWLRGEPALHLKMTGPAGTLAGTVWPASGLAVSGRAREVELSLLPLDHLADPLPVLGRVDADFDLRTGPNGPTGELRFEAWDGSIALPQFPFGIPYEEIRGELERGESGSITVRAFMLDSPMVSATAEGSVGASHRPEDGTLDLEVDLVVADPALRDMIQPYGVRFDPAGNVRFRVSGTVAHPVLR
jgi:type II secretion system protein N